MTSANGLDFLVFSDKDENRQVLSQTLTHKINSVGTYSGGSLGSWLRDAVVIILGSIHCLLALVHSYS